MTRRSLDGATLTADQPTPDSEVLICCRNRQYRENGNYADDLAAAIARLEFVLRDLMTGLVSPVDVQAEAAAKLEQKHIQ